MAITFKKPSDIIRENILEEVIPLSEQNFTSGESVLMYCDELSFYLDDMKIYSFPQYKAILTYFYLDYLKLFRFAQSSLDIKLLRRLSELFETGLYGISSIADLIERVEEKPHLITCLIISEVLMIRTLKEEGSLFYDDLEKQWNPTYEIEQKIDSYCKEPIYVARDKILDCYNHYYSKYGKNVALQLVVEELRKLRNDQREVYMSLVFEIIEQYYLVKKAEQHLSCPLFSQIDEEFLNVMEECIQSHEDVLSYFEKCPDLRVLLSTYLENQLNFNDAYYSIRMKMLEEKGQSDEFLQKIYQKKGKKN